MRLPDFPFPSSDPDAFATKDEILAFIADYAKLIAAPIRCGVTVTELRCRSGAPGFVAETPDGAIEATNVVIATGPYQRPIIPALLPADTSVFQVHASGYRGPSQLPSGAVLVVGSGASGAQITEELCHAGRRVYLAVGRHRRMPRRYRGRDLIWWLSALGLDQTPAEKRGPDKALPLITGAGGGHTIDFRGFSAQGVTLLGHMRSMQGRTIEFAPDLADSLAHGDAAYVAFLDRVDDHVARNGLGMPEDPGARVMPPDPPCLAEPFRRIDLDVAAINSVIWATGYGYDFAWIDVPVLDAHGEPNSSWRHHRLAEALFPRPACFRR